MTTTDSRPVAPGTSPTPTSKNGTKRRGWFEQALVYVVVILPVIGVGVGAYLAATDGWLTWTDTAIMAVFYLISGLGITVGFHRYFTHQSFVAKRWLKIALGISGSMALQGPVIRWTADHRRHHAYSDKDGDPHSPWRFGKDAKSLLKGLWWAHTGWLFDREQTSARRWAPDLCEDSDVRAINKAFPLIALASLGLPAVLGYALTGTGEGAFTAYIWAGLVRVFLVHHVTWSINSICHVTGTQPYTSKDEARNVKWLAIPSFGESWHNMHHADPRSARHGAGKGEIDTSAALIRGWEKLGWVSEVRWPTEESLDRLKTLEAKRAAKKAASEESTPA